MIIPENPYPQKFHGITGVWAKKNALSSIFEALKSRRCYGFMGGKITLDFRINCHYMGEEIKDENDERTIYYKIEADEKIDTVTLVKNGRDYIILKDKSELLFLTTEKKTIPTIIIFAVVSQTDATHGAVRYG